MKLCIPVMEDNGLLSKISQHFGSAPSYLIVDTETGEARTRVNNHEHHAHGGCNPLKAIQGEELDGVVVGHIGRGALHKLEAAGLTVYFSQHQTVAETLDSLQSTGLPPARDHAVCQGHGGGHGHGGGCGGHHKES
jgi:predicted Fe-Mo cluster-binding NifX family protein